MKQLEGRENTLPQTNSPLMWCGNMLPQPCNTTTTPRQQQGTVKASLPQQGSRRRVCSRYQCPREKAREDRKSGFRPRFKRGILNGGRCSLQRGSGGWQQRWGSRFGRGLLAEMVPLSAEPPQPLTAAVQTQPNAQEVFLLCSPNDGAGPGSGPWEGGEGLAPQHGKCLLQHALRDAFRWLWEGVPPYHPCTLGQAQCNLKIPAKEHQESRLRAAAPGIGSASQLPRQAVPWGITRDGDWFTWGRPFFPASMPPACPMHKNSSRNAVSRGEGSFSPCLPGHEGPRSPPMGVQSLAPLHWSLPVASPLRENRDAPEAVKGRVEMPPLWEALG